MSMLVFSAPPAVRAADIDELRLHMRRLDGGFGDPALRPVLRTGIALLDAALPGGGVPSGALLEIVPGGPCGRQWAAGGLCGPPWSLALHIVRSALRAGREAVIIDRAREVYPPALAMFGIDLARLAIVLPRTRSEAAWAFAEALGPAGPGPPGPSREGAVVVAALEGLSATDARRLELRAEAGGAIGVLVGRPPRGRSGAAVRLVAAPRPGSGETERFAVEVARCRGGLAGGVEIVVEVDRAEIPLPGDALA
jgi:hypothetical protein